MKLNRNLVILLVVLVLIGLSTAAVYYSSTSLLCSDIVINYKDHENGKHIENESIINVIRNEYGELLGMEMNQINIAQIEEIIDRLPQVKDANVYKDAKGKVYVEIDERVPILRIFPEKGNSMYLDTEGFLMPVSKKTPARVLIVNGRISLPDTIAENQRDADNYPMLKELFPFAQYVMNDSFFSAQIQQIYFDENGRVILIPRVGPHDIVLGDFDDYKNKLRRLRYFYFNIIGDAGWNKYERLNLSFKNQLVANKRK